MAPCEAPPFAVRGGRIEVAVRAAPKSSRNRIVGIEPEAGGGSVLKVAVTAAPEGGKANTALLKLLAKEWGMPRRALAIVRGETERRKTIAIEGEPARVRPLLMEWMERLDG